MDTLQISECELRMSASKSNWCHAASAVCPVPALEAFRFLGDGLQLGRWGLGSFQTLEVAPGLFSGTSLFDGSRSLIRLVSDPDRLQVDYHVGSDPETLKARIIARVVALNEEGGQPSCIVSLIAWRSATMDDRRWERLMACHDAEVHLICALLEQPVRHLKDPAS
jgi:hypothetical protein